MLSYTKAVATCNSIVAHLDGPRTCTAAGVTATGAAPVLTLCRELLAAGLDPDAAMQVYRNGILALRVRSLREGAHLAVEDDHLGQPKFRRWRGPRGNGAASPIAQLENSEPVILEAAGT
jgi:hypothetical protein